jgi:hypothetical protein
MKSKRALVSGLAFAYSIFCVPVHGQAPTGTISGTVMDFSGGSVSEATVLVVNTDSGLTRNLTTTADGNYSAPALPPGVYRVTTVASGYARLERTATVEAGTTTITDFVLQLGEVSALVTVSDTAPLLRYDQHQLSGLISRKQIENLPLNGRNFLELAKLEPGVLTPTRGNGNRTFVPVLGAPGGNSGSRTRVTVDGGSIMAVFLGGSAMNFSADVVREFQLASVNFDLSTGETASGAVNIVTRAGGQPISRRGFFLLPRSQSGSLSCAQSRPDQYRSVFPTQAIRL